MSQVEEEPNTAYWKHRHDTLRFSEEQKPAILAMLRAGHAPEEAFQEVVDAVGQ